MKVLAEGKGNAVRRCLKEVGVQSCEPTCLSATHRQADRNSIKAQSPGKLAPHNKTHGSRDRVNAAVAKE
ncbi:MAG: hypothetical protein JRI67_07590 [Deltaproteobacteria bacterium]|nr:hypothetical protein [Deltaproteobacteria bacterium]